MQAASVQVDHPVRLTQDIPELGLHSGQVGVVCSTWFEPTPAYEVEFQPPGKKCGTRALLQRHQIQDVESLDH